MDYKQKYKEAFERARNIHEYSSDLAEIKRMEYIFPELRESEDEKIRKELIEFVKSRGGFKQEYIAWLEKQGENHIEENLEMVKPAWSKKDEKIVTGIINDIQERLEYYPTEQLADIYFKEIKWLKSLKQRHTWKPTSTQMKALDSAIDEFDGYPEFDSLVSLKKDLEKLKGE